MSRLLWHTKVTPSATPSPKTRLANPQYWVLETDYSTVSTIFLQYFKLLVKRVPNSPHWSWPLGFNTRVLLLLCFRQWIQTYWPGNDCTESDMISLPLLPSSPLPNYLSFPGSWMGNQSGSQERLCLPTTWQATVQCSSSMRPQTTYTTSTPSAMKKHLLRLYSQPDSQNDKATILTMQGGSREGHRYCRHLEVLSV